MVALEVATAISVIIGAAGVCLAKLFKELRKTRIRTCSCFGINCTQDELGEATPSEGSDEEATTPPPPPTTPPPPPTPPNSPTESQPPKPIKRVNIPEIFNKSI